MRALITGITGFAGGHLAQCLLDRGDTVLGIARSRQRDLSYLSQPIEPVITNLFDLTGVESLIQDIQPDVIFHLAGQPFVPTAWADPWATMENNIRPQLNILRAMARLQSRARLLVVASNEVYGHVPDSQLPVTEERPMQPENPYGVSKVAQDVLALQYHLSHDIDVIRVRAFNHVGPRQSPFFVAASFAKQIAEIEASLSQPIIRVGNLEAQRDFTDVADITQAYRLLAEHGTSGDAYNVGTGQAYSIKYLLDVLLSHTDINIHIEQDPTRMRPADVPIIYADNSKLRSQTSWRPIYKFEESLRRVLDYWRTETQALPQGS